MRTYYIGRERFLKISADRNQPVQLVCGFVGGFIDLITRKDAADRLREYRRQQFCERS